MARLQTIALALLVLIASTGEGHTGTYGGVDRAYEGFRVYIDASVGSLSDPSLEAAELESNLAVAERELTAVEPALLAMMRHFADGKHPYPRAAALLDRTPRAEPDPRREVRLAVRVPRPPSTDLLLDGGSVEVWVMLYIKDGVPEPLADTVAAGFVASQVFGGALAQTGSSTTNPYTTPLDQLTLQIQMASGGPAPLLHRILDHARAHDTELRTLAKDGHPMALALVALRAGKPYPPDVVGRLDTLAPEHRSTAVRILVLLAPDAHRAATIKAMRRWLGADPGRPRLDTGALVAWLDAMAP